MGRTLDQLKGLLYPLQRVADHITTIPPHESLWVRSESFFRVVYFVEGDLNVKSSSGEQFQIHKGDALLVGTALDLTYTALKPEQVEKIHILKVEIRRSKNPIQPSCHANDLLDGNDFLHFVEPWMNGLHLIPGAMNKFGTLELIKQIIIELEQKESLSTWRISGLCMALISPLFETTDEDKTLSEQALVHRGEAAVEHAGQYIQQYLHHDLTLGGIAWQVQLSGEHLGRLFKKYKGITVMNFVKKVRLDKARHYLITSDLPVVDIANKTGYSTPSLLCRHFKEKHGMTPLAYRMRAHKRESFFPSSLSSHKL